MKNTEIDQILAKYYGNDAEKLHKMVDGMLKKFGGISDKDMDDFYSLANEVFAIALEDFDGTGTFDGFLKFRLSNKIKSMITARNRKKRANIEIRKLPDGRTEKVYHMDLSLYEPIYSDGKECFLGDLIPSEFSLENELSEEIGISFSEKTTRYIKSLPICTQKVVLMICEGYKPGQIQENLHMTSTEYLNHMRLITSYEHIKCLI